MSLTKQEDQKLYEYIDQQQNNDDDRDDDAKSNASRSSGFSSFEGFDLNDMSDEEDIDMDEIELPGKTYEFVNFVDPTYAERHIAKQASRATTQSRFSHSSFDEEPVAADPYHSPFPTPDTHQSSRSLPGKLLSRTTDDNSSQPHLAIAGSYSLLQYP